MKENVALISEEPTPPAKCEMPVTGQQVAKELSHDRLAAEQGVSRDALVYLRAGMNSTGVSEIIRLRWPTVPKEKIEQVVLMAVQLEKQKLEKQERKP